MILSVGIKLLGRSNAAVTNLTIDANCTLQATSVADATVISFPAIAIASETPRSVLFDLLRSYEILNNGSIISNQHSAYRQSPPLNGR